MKKNEEIQIVVFELEGEEFGIDINKIKEIIRIEEIINVPSAPSYIMGITNLRGNILPVVNTRIKLDLEDKEVNNQSRMLVIEKSNLIFSIVVDKVNEVIRVKSDLIEKTPGIITNVGKEYIQGVLKLNDGGRLVLLLNIDEVIKDSETGEISKELKNNESKSAKEEQKNIIEEEQLVTFNLGNEEYGFSIETVREILRVNEITPMPNAPSYVKGVETVRGALLPIIDLRKLFNENTLNSDMNKTIEAWEEIVKIKIDKFLEESKGKNEFLNEVKNDEFLTWIDKFDTSNEEILDILAKMKNSFKIIDFTVLRLKRLDNENIKMKNEILNEDINPQIEILFKSFEKLKNIDFEKEQRILVVTIGGVYVGITVDSVNEVKIFAKSLIEEIPELISSGSKELKSAIKANDGKKLIIILDEEKLISETETKILSKMKNDAKNEEIGKKDIEEEQYVVFNILEEEFGIKIESVNEINRIDNVTKMPKTPEFIEGMTNLRGQIIPLISLRTKFGIEKVAFDNRTRIVIVDINSKKIGMIVDRVTQIIKIRKSELEEASEMMVKDKSERFINKIAKLDNGERMIMTLDTEKMFESDSVAISNIGLKNEMILEQ